MKLLNNPRSIIGKVVYCLGNPEAWRRVTGIGEYGMVYTVQDDGSPNGGHYSVYTFEPFRDAPRLTLQDLQ